MTLLADPVAFIYKGEPCTMSVARNNGDCWGYVKVLRTGREFSISTHKDWYDQDDEEAAQAFIRAVKRKHHIDGQELFAMQSVEEVLMTATRELRDAWNVFKRDALPATLPHRKAALFERLDAAICCAEKAICV